MPLRDFKKKLLFSSLFNNAGLGVAVVNNDGLVIKVNKKLCTLLEYSEEELLELSIKDFTYPDDIEKGNKLFEELISGKIDSYEIEKRYLKKNGTVFWVLLTVSIIRQDQNTEVVLGVVQNIDARKKAEQALLETKEQLSELNSYKDKLFSVIAHDLRSSIGGTTAALKFIEANKDVLSMEQKMMFLSKLTINASKSSELLDNLLIWSKSQFQEAKPQPADLQLLDEVSDVEEQLRFISEPKGVIVQINLPATLTAYADRQMLQVIIRNLLSNAIKFSKQGQKVIVDAVKESAFVYISVTDEGAGIEESKISNLLNKNLEAISSYGTAGEKGTGLGINLCADYIEQLGGKLQISSEPDKGSRFTFSIPADVYSSN